MARQPMPVGGLDMWTIFDHPADHPDHFVVRRFVVFSPANGGVIATEPVDLADTIEQARGVLPPGLYRVPRQDGDEPQVVETWF